MQGNAADFESLLYNKAEPVYCFIMERVMFYGKCYCSYRSGGFNRKCRRVYNKGKEKWREMYRLSGRRELPVQCEAPQKKTGRPRNRQKNNENIRNALCTLRRARISFDREIEDSVLKNAVEKTGYHVVSIS